MDLRFVNVAFVQAPMALATRPQDDTLYIGSRAGLVWAIRNGHLDRQPVLDISDEVSTDFDRGLLGLTFSPDGGWLYVDFTNRTGAVTVVGWPFADGKVRASGSREIITIPQPGPIHHGGDITFGPDGDLWVTTGDATDESASETATTSQSPTSLLGKLVRIEPTPTEARPYRIPSDNPFSNGVGGRPEIFAGGLRNPWRFSFDRVTGDLWVSDVGRYQREEVDFLKAGRGAGSNFGWNRLEGTMELTGPAPQHNVLPLYEYAHTETRCAVIGGYVYRGSSIPALWGAYLFVDWCEGVVRALVQHAGSLRFDQTLSATLNRPNSLGQDGDGEIYALSPHGVFQLRAA